MTAADKKRILRGYTLARARTKRLRDRLYAVKSSALAHGISYDGVGGGSGEKDLSGWAAEWDDLERQIRKAYADELRQMLIIQRGVNDLDDHLQRHVIEEHYIRGFRIEEIAKDLGYSESKIWKVHRMAIRNITFRKEEQHDVDR